MSADEKSPDEGGDANAPSPSFFIVGVGASAGGLEALTALLSSVKLDGMAFVVVQHLAPRHESLLPALLARTTSIAVVAAEDGMQVEPNQVYVIPPNSDLAILQGVLHVMTPPRAAAPHGPHLPIDYFFRSLADDQGTRAIGIVLSGTGTDGTFGLRAIKEAGGITFAQDPASAKYDGMPRSALESGWADFCLPPDGIAQELKNISQHPYLSRTKAPPPQMQESMGKLIVLIRTAFGNDLSYYKPATIDRRIERRMALHKIEKLPDYIKFVQGNADELRQLYKDMLISVTSFFRDAETFERSRRKVFPRLLEHKEVGSHIRVWVPACSTGEEAYSIAIACSSSWATAPPSTACRCSAPTSTTASMQHARRGVYPQNIALDVSPERLQRFFIKKDSEYQVARRIRDMVVFSVQNVTKDAPFSRLDLVSCRNLLIYLRPGMQKKVLRILHYALQPDRLPAARQLGDRGRVVGLFLARRPQEQDLREAQASRRPAALDFGFGVQAPDPAPAIQPDHRAAVGEQPGDRRGAEDPGPLRAAGRGHQRGPRHHPHPGPHRAVLRADAGRAQLQHPAPRAARAARRSAPGAPPGEGATTSA